MKLFNFDPEVGKNIDSYDSSGFILSKVVSMLDNTNIKCAYLDSGGVIGYHQTMGPQLFLVVQGEGWVRGESPEKYSIKAGRAAYWEAGEWHEAQTETGLTAILIECENNDPTILMPPV